jgi:hypothetical protein
MPNIMRLIAAAEPATKLTLQVGPLTGAGRWETGIVWGAGYGG